MLLRRYAARCLDWALVVAVCSPLWAAGSAYVHDKAATSSTGVGVRGFRAALEQRWSSLLDGLFDDARGAGTGLWGTTVTAILAVLALHVAVAVAYEALMTAYVGRTIGKALLRLRVVGTGTAPPRLRAALGRAVLAAGLPGLAWVLAAAAVLRPNLPLAFGALGLLALSTAGLAGRWHDRAAGTRVERSARPCSAGQVAQPDGGEGR